MYEVFNESKEPGGFFRKGFASGVIGMTMNLVLLLLISGQAAFVALLIVKTARYFSTAEIK